MLANLDKLVKKIEDNKVVLDKQWTTISDLQANQSAYVEEFNKEFKQLIKNKNGNDVRDLTMTEIIDKLWRDLI
ncbi:MAG: hypothetical protein R3Y64_09505 [Peptostreptococcaceae bacterium]